MNKITQYRPAYFEGFDNAIVEFETIEELSNIPFVKKFMTDWDNCPFDKFVLYRGGGDPPKYFLLKARYLCTNHPDGRPGFSWGVGYLDKDIPELLEA